MLKIGLFIDIANQVDALSEHCPDKRIDYWKLKEFFTEDNEYLQANLLWKQKAYGIYYTDDGVDFIKVLASLGYKASFIKTRNGNKPNRILEIALDIIDAYPKLDIVVIGSNSIEFLPLIEWLRVRSVRVWIVTPGLMHSEGDINIDLLNVAGIIEAIHTIQTGPRTNDERQIDTTEDETKSSYGTDDEVIGESGPQLKEEL